MIRTTLPSRRVFRRVFLGFLAVSLAVHLLIGWGARIPDLIHQRRERARAEEAARLQLEKTRAARAEAGARKREIDARNHQAAVTDAREQVVSQLHDQFHSLVGDSVSSSTADEVWADVLSQLDTALGQYADHLADTQFSDADLRDQTAALQGRMLDELLGRLRKLGPDELKKQFLARVNDEVVPQVAAFYKKQIEDKVGNALRDEAARLIREEAAARAAARHSAIASLKSAEDKARAAQEEWARIRDELAKLKLASSATRPAVAISATQPTLSTTLPSDAVAQGNNSHDAANAATTGPTTVPVDAPATAPAEPPRSAVADSVPALQHAADALASAHAAATDAAAHQVEIGDRAARLIREAAVTNPAASGHADAESALRDATAGDAAAASGDAKKAADAAAKLADALHAARGAAEAEAGDYATTTARAAIKQARDADIRAEIERSFRENFAQHALPRLSDKLTGTFRSTLESAGVKDDAAVAEVDRRVRDALGEKLHVEVAAGESGTGPLSRAEHLDDIDATTADNAANGSHTPSTRPHRPQGRLGPGGPTTQEDSEVALGGNVGGAHGTGGGAATAPSTQPYAGNGHGSDAGDKLTKFAHGLAGSAIPGIAGDGSGDAGFAAAASGRKGDPGEGIDAGGEDAGGVAGLMARVSRLAKNVKSGRSDLEGAGGDGTQSARAGDGRAGSGAGFGAGGGLARIRQEALERSHGYALRHESRPTDAAAYAKLTEGIHERDTAAAQGHATTRKSSEGEVLTAADLATVTALPQPARVVAPAQPTTEPTDTAEKHAAFAPAFQTIAFAAIPFRPRTITLDGELSEWSDVPALPLRCAQNDKEHPELKRAPQAVRVCWDSSGIWVGYNVIDADEKITKADPGDFWEGDAVEVWVDAFNLKSKRRNDSSYQFWAWVSGSAKDPAKVGGEAIRYGSREDFVAYGVDRIQTASKTTAAGWSIEVHIPVERFERGGIDLRPGRIIGMNFSVCTGTPIYYYWAGTSDVRTSMRPDTWGDVLLAGCEGKLQCIDKLAGELSKGQTARLIASLRIGEPLRIRVTDADMNLSEKVKDKVTVTAATHDGGRQIVVLEETEPSSGVFEGAIRTTLNTGVATPGALPLFEGESIELTYIDACRPDGSRDVPVHLKLPTASAITATGTR